MRKLAFTAATAAALVAGAAASALASPASSTLAGGPSAQATVQQVHDGCYWRYGRYHCDRGYHRGWWGYRDDWRGRHRHRDRW